MPTPDGYVTPGSGWSLPAKRKPQPFVSWSFDENKHPRADDGKFATSPGGGGAEEEPKAEKPAAAPEAPKAKAEPKAEEKKASGPLKPPGKKLSPDEKKAMQAHLNERKAGPKAAQGASLAPSDLEKLQKLGGEGVRLPASYVPSEAFAIGGPKDNFVAKWYETGKDGKLCTQRAYTVEQLADNARKKWARIKSLEPSFDSFRQKLRARISEAEPGSREHAALTACAVISETALRPGGSSGGRSDHYGVTTMEGRHVSFEGGNAFVEYVGKEGIVNKATIQDATTVEALHYYAGKAKEGAPLIPASAQQVRASAGEKVKDFRTLIATRVARSAAEKHAPPPPPLPSDPKKAAKAVAVVVRGISSTVCERLNNSWSMSRDNYIHPEVWKGVARTLGYDGPITDIEKKLAKLAKKKEDPSAAQAGAALSFSASRREEEPEEDEGSQDMDDWTGEVEPENYAVPVEFMEAWEALASEEFGKAGESEEKP